MKICSFIVSFNRVELLKKCYVSLKSQTHALDEIIIIDNGSTDGTKDWLKSVDHEVTVIHQENTGGAGGFRRGFDYAYENGYDWVIPFDDDCEPSRDYLEKALPFLNSGEFKICTGQFFDEGKDQYFAGAKEFVWNDRGLLQKNGKTYYTEDAGFPFLIVHRDIFESVGFPYKFWFIYLDDSEWIMRIIREGYQIRLLPIDAGVHHSGRQSKYLNFGFFKKEIQIYGTWKTYYFFRNGIIFRRISGQNISLIVLRLIPKFILILFQKKEHLKRFKEAFRAIKDGLSINLKGLE